MLGARIRRATPEDVDGILRCLRAAFEPCRRRYTPVAYAATVLTVASARRRLRTMSVWVAVRENQQVVGTVALKSVSRHRGHLRGMAVLPEFQGTGLASALLRTAIRAAAKNGERRVTLETTEPLERATQFYLRHGFRTSGRRRQWGGMKLIEFERAVPTRVLPHRGTREVGRVPDVQVT